MSYKGIIYPDIHDENIMVDKEDTVRFIDFGSCSFMEEKMAQKTTETKGPFIVYQRLIPILYLIANKDPTLVRIIDDLKSTKNIESYMESLNDIIDS